MYIEYIALNSMLLQHSKAKLGGPTATLRVYCPLSAKDISTISPPPSLLLITANILTCIFFVDARCQNFRERFYCVKITVADVD